MHDYKWEGLAGAFSIFIQGKMTKIPKNAFAMCYFEQYVYLFSTGVQKEL